MNVGRKSSSVGWRTGRVIWLILVGALVFGALFFYTDGSGFDKC